MSSELLEGVTWFRGSSIRIRRAGIEVHVDPYGHDADTPDAGRADFILLTHPHYDNFSEEDIDRLRSPDTVVVAPATMKKQLNEADHFLRAGDVLQLRDLDLLAMPAYNVDKRYHPPEAGWLGYVFTLDGVTYYHAGDTDLIEAMMSVRCDVAFLPVDGHYTMNAGDAARAGIFCGANVVVPIRWSDGPTADEAMRLASAEDLNVELLERTV
ncbi:MAG: MBL fold metallo-hydrolase [Gemmatimonadetes bacterium]|nr:MBL fold metallo-hydrolase [Gemmatimonadota bacterium]NNF38926.1 MBL fold metallo-hydrolase [Gemmatimonadota bacterium]NNK62116.1 MBL fold metallo-hydrolase [Gemmatimonadota bacterium]